MKNRTLLVSWWSSGVMEHFYGTFAKGYASENEDYDMLYMANDLIRLHPSDIFIRRKSNFLLRLLTMLFPLEIILRSRELKRYARVHIMSGEGMPANLWLLIFISSKCHLTVTWHDYIVHKGDNLGIFRRIFEKVILHRANVIHVMSIEALNVSAKLAKKMYYMPHFCLAKNYEKSNYKNLAAAQKEFDFVVLGSPKQYKGLKFLEKCIAATCNNYKWLLIGQYEYSHSNVQVISKYIPDRELGETLSQARTLFIPYEEATQSSLPTIAVHFGLNIISTSTGALTKDVSDLGGTLISHGDVRTFTREANQSKHYLPKICGCNELNKFSVQSTVVGILNAVAR